MVNAISEFKKNYKIQVPVHDHFWYYIGLLRQSREFDQLDHWLATFKAFEDERTNQAVKEDRVRWQNKLIAHFKSTNAFQIMNAAVMDKSLPQKKLVPNHTGKILVSVDLVKANYSILRTFHDDIPPTWGDFCDQHDVPEVLAQSKSFRQVVFGNLNPRRQQRFQLFTLHQIMDFVRGTSHSYYGKAFEDDDVMFISPDEFIVTTGDESWELPRRIRGLIKRVRSWNESSPHKPQAKVTFFRIDPIEDGSEGSIRTHYGTAGKTLVETHKSLFGVPGSRFYLNFKQHILGGELEPRDLQFMQEKHIAQWVV